MEELGKTERKMRETKEEMGQKNEAKVETCRGAECEEAEQADMLSGY